MSERDYYLGFSVFPGVGAGRFQLLLDHFGSAEKAWNASEDELKTVLKDKLTVDFLVFRKSFDVGSYKEKLEKSDVSCITFIDETYPIQLKDLPNPPFVLYVKGKLEILQQVVNGKVIGVVGTRKMTTYGRQITESFTRDLVEQDIIIASGLALGVDAIAHQTTVENGGKTIAVLGCGVDCCYPTNNYGLYEKIIKTGGLIVSEYPLSAPPNKGSFPSRNRIIAALSRGLLVTEGAEDSGSLITAGIALELGRMVFAIPGPVTSSLSRGPLKLIHKGAKLVTGGEEILEELGVGRSAESRAQKEIKGETDDEQKIIDCLMNEDLTFDDIVKNTQITAGSLGTILSLMEMKDIICILPSGKYMLTS